MIQLDLKMLELASRIEKKIANIHGAVPLVKLSDHPSLKENNPDVLSVLQYGYVATIYLEKYESTVPNGKNIIDRSGYYYSSGPFTEPMYTLSEWREAYTDDHKPHLLISANWFNIWESGIPANGNKINPRQFNRNFLAGLSVSNGDIVSKHTVCDQGNIALDSILINKKSSTATILCNSDLSTYSNQFSNMDAVSGFLILKEGTYVPSPNKNNYAKDRIPRSGIGISKDGKTLFVIVIQTGIKQCGVTANEFADIFKKLGAKEAINLDNNGSSELLYVGTNWLGQEMKIQTQTSDTSANGHHDSERPKPNFIGFYPKDQKRKARDDAYLLFGDKKQFLKLMNYSKDELELAKTNPEVKHDSYFNNKRKVLYESRLAQLFMQSTILFNSLISKISNLIVGDIQRIISDDSSLTSYEMRAYFKNDYDLNVLFQPNNHEVNIFFDKIISVLKDNDSDNFYQHMCIHRTYSTFFMEKGKAKPSLDIAKAEGWFPKYIDLDKMLNDLTRWREYLFDGNKRNLRGYSGRKGKLTPSIFKLTSKNIGIIPTEEYKLLPKNEQIRLIDKLPIHKPGMEQYYITTEGIYTNDGMHRFDMPQICGPSGMTAMRLALANQANLSQMEKELYAFAVGMYHVAIGAHTVDENFCIASNGEFTHYQRGNYESILPMAIKNDLKFKNLFHEIKKLNTEFSDIFYKSDEQHSKSHDLGVSFKLCK